MNPNEFYKDNPEAKWKILCYRFIGRSRRLDSFNKMNCPETIINMEKKLIQKAYEEMREACLSDETYLVCWENKSENNS